MPNKNMLTSLLNAYASACEDCGYFALPAGSDDQEALDRACITRNSLRNKLDNLAESFISQSLLDRDIALCKKKLAGPPLAISHVIAREHIRTAQLKLQQSKHELQKSFPS